MTTNLYRVFKCVTVGTALWLTSHVAGAACLTKPRQMGDATVQIFMLAPEQEVAAYQTLGFSRIDCPTDLTAVREYVDRLCDGAPRGPIPPLNTDVMIGRPRALACASARAGLAEAGG